MKQVGAVRSQVHSVVPRQVLLAWVEMIESAEAQDLVRRREVAEQIDERMAEQKAMQTTLRLAGKQPVEFAITREILQATLTSLPPEIEITPGRIIISFNPDDPDPACQLLYQLGLALSNDFDSFLAVQQVGNTAVIPLVIRSVDGGSYGCLTVRLTSRFVEP